MGRQLPWLERTNLLGRHLVERCAHRPNRVCNIDGCCGVTPLPGITMDVTHFERAVAEFIHGLEEGGETYNPNRTLEQIASLALIGDHERERAVNPS